MIEPDSNSSQLVKTGQIAGRSGISQKPGIWGKTGTPPQQLAIYFYFSDLKIDARVANHSFIKIELGK
ncbi:MAG: hypothetical protein ACM37W_14630 [Actinomycetota bacterium]